MAAGASVTIYALLHPETKECRYVGKAIDLASRVRNHRWEAKSTPLHTRKVNWLRSLGQDPLVQVLEEVAFERWAQAERHWISHFRNLGYRLTNYADGGQTSPVEGNGHTEESKSKMREAALRNGARPPSRKGTKSTPETIAKLKEALKRDGRRPPMMGGWNKGVRAKVCLNGHSYREHGARVIFRKSENRYLQVCKQCERSRQVAYRLKIKGV